MNKDREKKKIQWMSKYNVRTLAIFELSTGEFERFARRALALKRMIENAKLNGMYAIHTNDLQLLKSLRKTWKNRGRLG